ncbi:MAG: hypothetical protein F6K09_28525, partial [Merismopedia sp. SIO2A8]|nr:hypothetical protein [Merismopedia sp. SIO2A8]
TTFFASLFMARVGRTWGFRVGASIGLVGALVNAGSVATSSFMGLCLGSALVGVYSAFVQYHRFAAAEIAPQAYRSRAISWVLAGAIWGAMGGFLAQEMVASGSTFQIKNILDAGPLASGQIPKDLSLRVNRFWIDYTPEGGIDQFYSDISVLDSQGGEVDQETIYVNKPLRYQGVTFYQTDWGIASVLVQLNNSPIFQLPMAQLDTGGRGRVWGTWVPTKPDLSTGVSLLAKDLQGMLLVYDVEGKLISTVRPGMATKVNDINLKIIDIIGSTGLQIKADPGIPLVYTGFALLMLGVIASYFSHSQIWAWQQGVSEASPQEIGLYVGGKTNRAQVAFEREVIEILEKMSKSKQEIPSLKAASLVN